MFRFCRFKINHDIHEFILDSGTVANRYVDRKFAFAKIRLIPKKGNPTLLKNWCPINLLNCFCSLSLWRVVQGSKLMHLVSFIHGLFIT
jgi:hypothetical protein